MDPEKLALFSVGKLLLAAANQYLKQITDNEMPNSLKKYMEVELFPRIHLKATHGISLAMVRQWLHCEGFHYVSHKKGLFFDGHDRDDVIRYRQVEFIPGFKFHEPCLVQHVVGDVEKEFFI